MTGLLTTKVNVIKQESLNTTFAWTIKYCRSYAQMHIYWKHSRKKRKKKKIQEIISIKNNLHRLSWVKESSIKSHLIFH